MFTYTGLTETQVLEIRRRHHIYMMKSGRISMAGCKCLSHARIPHNTDSLDSE
jgi:aspartate aminotransferase